MKILWTVTVLLISILLFTGCATEPEVPETVPEETPVETVAETVEEPVEKVEEPIIEAPVEIIVEPVSEKEFLLAEQAIDRAESAGASIYSQELFLKANEDLEMAETLKQSDPDQSRLFLASSIKKANEAYDESINNQVDQKVTKLRILESQLIDINAERFSESDYLIVRERADRLIEYLNDEDYENAEKQYNGTLRAMQNLYDTLDNNIRWVNILDRDTKAYMSDAEEKEVFLWAPEELEKANYIYSEGIAQFNNFNLEASEKSLKEAKYWAFQSIRLSEERKRQNQTDTLMLEALENLEKASRNKVIDNEGVILVPAPWEGDDFLEENPAPDTTADDFSDDDSSLQEFDPDAENPSEQNNAYLPINGSTVVLGDEQKLTLLDQAIELWKQGVKARAEGKYDIADEYFKQSKAYSEAYSANAVANEYTVQRNDTLWAISAREDILDNPFLWTKIWRRNSKLIQNPDLIYPGQKLMIPPK